MNTFLHDLIPARARKAVYGVLGTIAAVELTLDAFDVGLVAEKPQAIAFAVASVLGFGMAFSNTET
jgi:hypothetical protein